MTASPSQLNLLNDADYERYKVPQDLGHFGSLSTAQGSLPLQAMSLRGEMAGLLYRLKLVQRFFNPYHQPLEATYIFPLPSRAAVSAFVMQTQSRRIVGELQERGAARRQYQEAVAQGKQAALAEEERAEVFTMTVGNIPPQEFVQVELDLDGPLSWCDGQVMFRFPLVVAPRYIPGSPYPGESVGQGIQSDTDAVPDASRISPPVLLPGYPNPVYLSVDLRVQMAGLPIQYPSVSLPDLLCWQEEGGFRISLRPTTDRLDRDLILRFPVPAQQIQSSLQVESLSAEEHFFALHLIPDDAHQSGPQVPRQVVALLDRSGSMEGWKMVCARRALGHLIDSLNDRDAFQILNFDTVVEPLDPNRTGLRLAGDRERYLALEKLGKVEARGGTEILGAIQEGLKLLKGSPDPFLILITDGQVGNESEVLRWVQQHAQGVRIFTLGIDRAVNLSLLERMAQVSGGHFTLVESEQQLDESMVTLRRRINPPLLQQVTVQHAHCQGAPLQVDLYQGLCSRQMGRITGPLPESLQLLGYSPQGQAFSNRLLPQRVEGVSLQKIWARERVLELEHGFLAGWKEPEYQPEAIANFALEHGVLCRFTAFVAVDDESFVPGTMHQVTQAVSTPDGWQEQAAEGEVKLRSMSAKPNLAQRIHGLKAKAEQGAAKPTLQRPLGGPKMGLYRPSLGGQPPSGGGAPPDPFGSSADPFGSAQPFAASADPFGPSADPFAAAADPFAAPADPFAAPADPFASAPPAADPFSAAPDPFASPPDPFADDPFTRAAVDLLTAKASASDPWKHSAPVQDPFASPGGGWVAASPPPPTPESECKVAMQRLQNAQTAEEWERALSTLIEALIRKGLGLRQVDPLLEFRRQLLSRYGAIPQQERVNWLGQVDTWLNAIFNPPGSSRQESFWR